jgi:hypothetical protein
MFRFTFEEGAWDKVPKTVRTFENLLLNDASVNRPENLEASSFDLNVSYSCFYLFIFNSPTVFPPPF